MCRTPVEIELTGRMPVECLRCERIYTVKPCTAEQDGQVSSGYCDTCGPIAKAEFNREFDAMRFAQSISPALPGFNHESPKYPGPDPA